MPNASKIVDIIACGIYRGRIQQDRKRGRSRGGLKISGFPHGMKDAIPNWIGLILSRLNIIHEKSTVCPAVDQAQEVRFPHYEETETPDGCIAGVGIKTQAQSLIPLNRAGQIGGSFVRRLTQICADFGLGEDEALAFVINCFKKAMPQLPVRLHRRPNDRVTLRDP